MEKLRHNLKHKFIERTQIYEKQILNKLEQLNSKLKQKLQDGQKNTTQVKKAEKTTFYYAQERIAKRYNDCGLIDNWWNTVISKYERVSFLLCAKEAIIDNDAVELIAMVLEPIKMYPDLLLDLVHIIPDPPEEIKVLLSSSELINPNISLVKDGFKYDMVTGQVLDAKYRYLINMDGMEIRKYLNDRANTDFNVRVNSELFMQLSNQSRWNNIWIQIAISLFYMDTISFDRALQNTILTQSSERRFGSDLITYQSICYMIKQWEMLPFQVRQDGVLDISNYEQVWSTCQVPLMYSLLELSKEERGCNITNDFLTIIIQYRTRCACTSFETETLDKKGAYSPMLKLISYNLKSYARYSFSKDYRIQMLKKYDENVEIGLTSDEYTELLKSTREKADSMFVTLFESYLKKLVKGTHTQNTELARWLSGVVLTMGNAGIYYKTSLVLEKEKSVASQTLGTLNFPKPEKLWYFNDMKLDLSTNWKTGDQMYEEISKRYKSAIQPYIHELNVDNLQEWFYTLLTNKSQGFKVDVDNFVNRMNIDPELLSDLRNVGQVRVASFLLDNEIYNVFERYIETLMNDGVCTIRFQNNRRARIVEIVPNVDQIGYAIVLKMFEALKSDTEEIAVGKQIGGISDMKLQLRISGQQNGISIFSDVSAMDAHTQPNVAVMFLKMLAEVIIEQKIGPLIYFPFKTTECMYENTQYSNNSNNMILKQVIPSLAQTLLYIASQRLNKKYLLKDKIFGTEIEINPTIFESGRFDTSAQHTKLLKFSADVVYERVKVLHGDCVGKYIATQRKFGDDSYECLEYNALTKSELTNLIDTIVKLTNESLYQVGLKSETELSSYYGDFLQQMAFCGVVIPKSARSSIYTDEKSALMNRDVISVITIMSNILTASAQRSYAPENIMSLVRNIWATNRLFRLLPSKPLSINNNLRKYVKQYGTRCYLQYPYILISLPPLNFPNQTWKFTNGLVLPASSSLRTVGLCKLNYIWNELFPVELRSELFSSESNLIGDVKVVDIYNKFCEVMKDTNIVESMIFSSYQRSQQLSKMRYERLSDPIMKMGNVAKNYFNQNMLRNSAAAAVTLKTTYGITMPDALLYYMKPIEQLKNMFEARSETEDEAIGLNDAYIYQMNANFKSIPQKLRDQIVNTCIFWETSHENVECLSPEFPELPLMPGYTYTSDYYRSLLLFGNALRDVQRTNRALVTFTNRYGGTYNLQAIHRIGLKAKEAGSRGNSNAFQLFLEAMQLPPRIRTAVEQMFASDDTVILDDIYSSGFQPEQMFALSDSIINVSNYVTFSSILNPGSKGTILVMLRDYLLLTSNIPFNMKKLRPRLPPATYFRYNLKTLLANVGVTGL